MQPGEETSKENKRWVCKACRAICDLWNAEVTTGHFLEMVLKIRKHRSYALFSDRPSRIAHILDDDWYHTVSGQNNKKKSPDSIRLNGRINLYKTNNNEQEVQ